MIRFIKYYNILPKAQMDSRQNIAETGKNFGKKAMFRRSFGEMTEILSNLFSKK